MSASPFAEWFDHLDRQAAAKVTIGIARLSLGNVSNIKGVGAGGRNTASIGGRGMDLSRTRRGNARDSPDRRHEATAGRPYQGSPTALGGLQTKEVAHGCNAKFQKDGGR